VIDGMIDNRVAFANKPVTYYPYIEPVAGAGSGLLESLSRHAGIVVTDDYPAFFLPRMIEAAGTKVDARLEVVDSNGLLPMAAVDRVHATAYSFRRTVQRTVFDHLGHFPLTDPCVDLPAPLPLPEEITSRWQPAELDPLDSKTGLLAELPIDHDVELAKLKGGSAAAQNRMAHFFADILGGYADSRNRPEEDGSSGLSPYLHFGHLSVHDVFRSLMLREGWTQEDTVGPANGRRAGWWGVSTEAEAFLDQIVTWRELGFNVCRHRADHDQWESLPEWARQTLEEHAADHREHVYSLSDFDHGLTHDDLWNAAQNQLRREGVMHNYLRMLWGKKILHWTSHPRDAREIMFELNNRYALDGRDPNSSTGIMWVLGRHDRPWGPERPIFGKVRYMSSANTRRKFRVKTYLEKYA
jgi:deoxyribodipyrimidine photo-lyase